MYELVFLEDFWENYKKLTKGNIVLQKQFKKALILMINDPFYPSLKTHKVDTKKYSGVYSSSVSGDVRISWALDKNQQLVILVLQAGTHSGADQIYKKKSS